MGKCVVENWTLDSIALAIENKEKENKSIIVPRFQRGGCWNKNQERKFIDSLKKGYPVGTMLFYETIENNKQKYILVDGLQRGTCIKNYRNNPTEYFDLSNIPDKLVWEISNLFKNYKDSEKGKRIIREEIEKEIKQNQDYSMNKQFYVFSNELEKILKEENIIPKDFNLSSDRRVKLMDLVSNFYSEIKETYEEISRSVIPIIIYSGNQDNLPEIFDRINSQGTPLDIYEIYAASWPTNNKLIVNNEKIIEQVSKKYDSLIKNGFRVQDYDRNKMIENKELSCFEYLFGLSKFLVNEYDILAFNLSFKDDQINPLGFELVNACLNESNKIKELYKNLEKIDINAFEKALIDSIKFVKNSISPIFNFKSNKRNRKKPLHSKYMILSMISSVFKYMYRDGMYEEYSDNWIKLKNKLRLNILHYYIYDTITNYWSEGGTSKIYNISKEDRLLSDISRESWELELKSYYKKTLERKENSKVASPKSEDIVILNSIYLSIFTAEDQLSEKKFDIEHIAPKAQMKKILSRLKVEEKGLPISTIANLCYLPDSINRKKKDKNIYQDKNIKNIQRLEEKYLFIKKEDLNWMDECY